MEAYSQNLRSIEMRSTVTRTRRITIPVECFYDQIKHIALEMREREREEKPGGVMPKDNENYGAKGE